MTVFIYCLTDPRTKQIRYVGKSIDPKSRYGYHAGCTENGHKGNWLRQLKGVGLKPEMEILEVIENCTDEGWQESERWWISYLRFIGCPLTNLDSGGLRGKRLSDEARRKISAATMGIKKAQSTKEKMSEAWTRTERRLQNSRLQFERIKSNPEAQQKLIEHRKRLHASMVGKKRPPMSAEWREKISRGVKAAISRAK